MEKDLNKILLEAINKGINLALDSFEDSSDILSLSHGKVISTNITEKLLNLINNFVDLDLPSGTLWAKYNLGVDINNLSTSRDWFGDYYAWGETETKDVSQFLWSTYKHAKGSGCSLTKYCRDAINGYNGYTDKKIQLDLEDDAAYQNMDIDGIKGCIPTIELVEELMHYTTYNPILNYQNIKHLSGMLFKGKNGKELFLPFAGLCHKSLMEDKSSRKNTGYSGVYWTANLCINSTDSAKTFYFNQRDSKIYIGLYDRYIGFSIRPVLNKRIY